jgi:pimeloyl-ACP methyl ester carboxylesterase
LAENSDPSPIRRGRGLRLSGPARPDEPAAESAPAGPIARGRGLRLTTHAPAEEPAPPLRAQARVPSGLTAYRRAGEGPPLLLLHGFGASGRIWRGVMAALADARACYAPDLPGFGESPARPAAPTLDALADELLAFADTLGLARFDLVGHSLGAAVAATVAGRSPERVGRLALTSLAVRPFAPELLALGAARSPLDLTLGLTRPFLEPWQPWGRWAIERSPAALVLAASLLRRPPDDQGLWRDYLADHAAADARAYITSVTSQGDPGLQTRLRAIAAPTLLIVGRQDRVARLPEAVAAQALIPGARLHVIEECGHLPLIEQPEAYNAALRAFFAP